MPEAGFIDLTITDNDGTLLLMRRIQTWSVQIGDHTDPLTQIGNDFLNSNAANFVSEGGEFAGGWAPLAPSTVLQKMSQGYGGGILVRSGVLMDSLTIAGAPGNVFNVSPNFLEVGTSIPYAAYHQDGTSRMPARPVVGLSWAMREIIVQRFAQWAQQMISE